MYQYQVSFGEAIKRAFSNYCVFTGRASRSEYWWFVLFNAVVSWILYIPVLMSVMSAVANGYEPTTGGFFGLLFWGYSIAVFLPSLGLSFRRLHDAGHSGWNICWSLLPVIGAIILIIYLCQESQPMENQYGPVPNLR